MYAIGSWSATPMLIESPDDKGGGNRLSDFNWLVGSWIQPSDGEGIEVVEHWSKADNRLEGLGVRRRQADTVFVEKLSLVEKDGEIYYSADVAENPAPVLFRLTSSHNGHAVFENPDHDFPKKIEYERVSEDEMTVVVSGDGRSVEFRFRKEEFAK